MLSRFELDATNRRLMFWCYLSIPIQYYAAYIAYYRFFIVWIPVALFIILPTRRLIAGHVKDVLRSVAIIQWALMLTVFSLSHIAYLLSLELPDDFTVGNECLILCLILTNQRRLVIHLGKDFWADTKSFRLSVPTNLGRILGRTREYNRHGVLSSIFNPFTDTQAGWGAVAFFGFLKAT